jgi:radical SAM protein with 4Fe4S-binding SPASM domain
MNLIVVDKCTNYCSYCFASTEMAKSTAKASLHENDIPFLINFIAASGPRFELNIIGGEPFLYRPLPELVSSLLKIDNLSKICIFTGGIIGTDVVKSFAAIDNQRISFLFNVNERKDYQTQREYDLVLKNMDLLLSYGYRCSFGYNIYKDNFDYVEILDLCEEYGTNTLRWTVAYPEAKANPLTTTLRPDQYAALASRVAEFLENAYHRGIKAGLDCPLPKCFFTQEQMGRIALTQPLTVNSIRSCGPVVDVSPRLEVFRCYALSGVQRTNLRDFKNFEEVVSYYNAHVDELYDTPQTFEYCRVCEFAIDRTCYGGCMAHSPQAIGKRKSASNLAAEIHRAINAGECSAAERIYVANRTVLRNHPATNFLMSYAAEGMGDREKAKRYVRLSIVTSTCGDNARRFAKRLAELLSTV